MLRPERSFYSRDCRLVARELLGCVLVTQLDGHRTSGRIIETEAYLGEDDAASHAFRGPTRRNHAMFMQGGHAYVYFIYGMYYCFNVVTGPEGIAEAVLIRGVMPLEGAERMQQRRNRPIRRDHELANGPGKLTIALGIGPALNGADLVTDRRIWIETGPAPDIDQILTTPRIGISKAVEHPWRWVVQKPNRHH